LLLEKLDAVTRVVSAPVVAVREVEGIDVPLVRREALVDQPGAELVGRADLRAARLADVEERVLVDFLGRRVVHDVPALDRAVLRAEPGVDPEALDPDDLLLLETHRARDVHHVDDHRVGFRLLVRLPGAVALVLADGDDSRVQRVVFAHGDLPLQRLLERALEVAERFGAGAVDPGGAGLLRRDRLLAARLDVRELELLAEDLGELAELDVDLEDVLARLVAGLLAAVLRLTVLAERLADVALALADAALLLRAVLEPRELDLR